MAPNRATFAVHTSLLFDPIKKAFLENISIEVNPLSGAIVFLHRRNTPDLPSPLSERDIDLRGKVVLPGFVDSHTHMFLHSDKCVSKPTLPPPPFPLFPAPIPFPPRS